MKPYLTVIIPTYNRAEKLDRSLAYLYEQGIAHDSYEVIVVNDGSKDKTDLVLKAWKAKWPQLTALHQDNSGQGIARNRAIKKAKGQVVLIGQDDIYSSPEFLESHIEFHQANPDPSMACLGLTEWWPDAEVTAFMKWLTHNGPQFAYNKLKANQAVDYWFFYTSNISIKTEVLKKNLFDADFKAYGWEDIELGHRLMKKGLELIYTPKALAWHDHFMEPSSLKKRMYAVGKGAPQLEKKCPGIKAVPSGVKLILLTLIGNPITSSILAVFSLLGTPFKRAYWYSISKRYFLRGLR